MRRFFALPSAMQLLHPQRNTVAAAVSAASWVAVGPAGSPSAAVDEKRPAIPAILLFFENQLMNKELFPVLVEAFAKDRELLREARESASVQRELTAKERDFSVEMREQRDMFQAQLLLSRGTLTKRWVLEIALRQAHYGDSTRWNKKFNATATAQQLAAIDSRAKDDIWECMVHHKMCPEDISKLYGKLSAGIHDSGLDVDSLVVQGNSSPVEHGFLICVANKRLDLSLSA